MQHARLSQRLGAWKDGWDPALSDPIHQVKDLGAPSTTDAESIVDISVPGALYDGPLFPATLLSCEWHTVVIMHECQAIAAAKSWLAGEGKGEDDGVAAALASQAYAICQIVETIELWPSSPKGSLIITQACLAIAALFLPHDAKHQRWIRRKFALLESMG
jgi:hypothetical protein